MAVHAPDPHNLRAISRNVAPIITVDRECFGCGYNLRGLRVGIPCPECGMPSVTPEGIDDPLSQMPVRVILAFIRGCWVASICVALMMGVVIVDRLMLWDQAISMMILACIGMLWVGAAMWLTPAFSLRQAAVRGFSRVSRLRRAARFLQLGWPVAAGAAWLALANTNLSGAAENALALAKWGGFLAGMAGLVLLSIMLERLAEWTRDGDAERLFNWATWALPVTTLMVLADFSHPLVRLVVFLLWLAIVCIFPWGLLSLSASVTLSLLHAKEYRDRLKRRDERSREYHANVAATVRRMDEARGRE